MAETTREESARREAETDVARFDEEAVKAAILDWGAVVLCTMPEYYHAVMSFKIIMNRTRWVVLILVVSTLAVLAFSYFCWFKRNEHVAIWLEGIALVFIFALDYVNRLDDSEQLALLAKHVEAATKQADAASENTQLFKNQMREQQLRELWRVLPLLEDLQTQTRYWLTILNDNRWNGVNSATKIMPFDSGAVLIQAARHSNDLWNSVRETFKMLSSADFALSRFYVEDRPQNRPEHLVLEARASLRNAEPRLTDIIEIFAEFERAERRALLV